MHWLMITINIVCSVIAILLAIFGLQALMVLHVKGVERTLWKPVLTSSVFFLAGSVLGLLYEVMERTMDILEALHHVSWLVGLCVLAYGVYIYLGMLKKIGSERL